MFQYFDDKAFKLLRKGVNPYDSMAEDWKNKLKEKELPNIKYFHSSLSNTNCSIDDYAYANETYDCFECKNVKDYLSLYVKTYVLLSGDEFASYREKSNSFFGIDPIFCISAPAFSNRAMLKMTNAKIELITDLNLSLIVKKGIR